METIARETGPVDRLVRVFGESLQGGESELRALLGGKGKSLFDMTELGLPVPPGFTLITDACRRYLASGWPEDLDLAIDEALRAIERKTGLGFGSAGAPLLVSVRSGGAQSMPGMMDTVLNVGLNDATTDALARASGDPNFAADCRERLRQSYLKAVDAPPPDDARAQLRGAIEAVFRSWNSDRARAYRRIEGLSEDAGTAVNIQMMVFGNRDERSGTGVVFSRDPSTGEPGLYGDVLFRAQGEDVVAGTHATLSIEALCELSPEIWHELSEHVRTIERRYRDLVEVEFTIESGRLWILQARVGKRSPLAALRIAHDLAEQADFPVSRAEAVARVSELLSSAACRKLVGPRPQAIGRGLAASPGIASGILVTRSETAALMAAEGRSVLLARPETSPSDVEGISAAAGLLTARGGFASHAAVVARGWGKPAVVGITGMEVYDDAIVIDGRTIPAGAEIALDGETGDIFGEPVEVADTAPPEAALLRAWRDGQAGAPGSSVEGAMDDDALVLLLAIKGMATASSLADLAGIGADALEGRLSGIAPFIERPNALFVKATAAAHARCADLIAAHRDALGGRAAEVLAGFGALNDRFKTLVTEWQMKPGEAGATPNDHADEAYDASVLAAAREGHERTMQWLAAIRPAGALTMFARRFGRAMERIDAGNTAFFVSPRVDSYHNVWFELHEYLIRLAGRTREQEGAH